MNRTVLTFERLGTTQTLLKLDVAPGVFAGQGDNLEVNLAGLPQGAGLRQSGEALLALLRCNQAVSAGLAAILANPVGAEPSPLYFHVRASTADVVAWEQVYAEPQGFCALDSRWPIGRIASEPKAVAPRAFTAPLRIVAVLSAAGRQAMPQLRVLLAAVAQQSLSVTLHVISGDAGILAAATAGGATAELIAPTSPGLSRQISDAHPQLLHVLCHGGGSPAGARLLAFGSSVDFDRIDPGPDDVGSIRMPVNALVAALLPGNPWLVVLASCQSAQAGDGREGLAAAHEMVSAGVPAVIGMRRLVDLTDTDRFCAELYPAVLDVICQAARRAAPDGQPNVQVLDWAQALTAPRVAMAGDDPTQVDSWTDPVLYAQEDPMEVFITAPQASPDTAATAAAQFAHQRGQFDQFSGALATLDPATTDPELIAELRARVAELQAKLVAAGG